MIRRPTGKSPSEIASITVSEAAQWWADRLHHPVDGADVVLVRGVPQCGVRMVGGPCLRPQRHHGEHRRDVHMSAKPGPSGGPAMWEYQASEDD